MPELHTNMLNYHFHVNIFLINIWRMFLIKIGEGNMMEVNSKNFQTSYINFCQWMRSWKFIRIKIVTRFYEIPLKGIHEKCIETHSRIEHFNVIICRSTSLTSFMWMLQKIMSVMMRKLHINLLVSAWTWKIKLFCI